MNYCILYSVKWIENKEIDLGTYENFNDAIFAVESKIRYKLNDIGVYNEDIDYIEIIKLYKDIFKVYPEYIIKIIR